MINEIKEQTSRLGLTIRDFAQFALPGFFFILALTLWLGLPVIRKDPSIFLNLLEKSGLILFISLAIISYLIGQFLASATHVIDNVCQILFRRRAFGVPFILSKLGTDYRAKVHDYALRKASSEINVSAGKMNDPAFDTLMELMLYRIMMDADVLYQDIQRHQAILYMRKHMVLAIWAWLPVLAKITNWRFSVLTITLVALVFWTGYRRLFRRTFFERLPLAYLSITEPKNHQQSQAKTLMAASKSIMISRPFPS